ncbi:twin-arginine translocation signal domain-containing protein [Roseimaritima multifibrata]
MNPLNASNRRNFLRQTAMATAAGVPALAGLEGLGAVSAAESQLPAGSVRFNDDVEPLIRLIEETPRQRVIEEVADRVRKGNVQYRQLLAALLLAGIRNVQPRPSVGHKFHAVLVVHSAHLASLSSPDVDRWLPLFWALDNFKSAQARDTRENNWTMSEVDEAAVPASHLAIPRLREALGNWDEAAADVAVVSLCRGQSAGTAFDLLAEFAPRDFRSIGHKAIYLANGYRTLQTIGWEHAEPVLRSVVYAMLNHQGEPNPAKSDLVADRDSRINRPRAAELKANWYEGKIDDGATLELLTALREVSPDDASRLVAEQLNRGVAPQSIYDAMFASAAELTMRQPAIVPLHAMTTTNAMHYTYQMGTQDLNRRFLLLQNASFLARFRDAATGRGKLADLQIDRLKVSEDTPASDLTEIFTTLRKDKTQAAEQALQFLQSGRPATDLVTHARRLIFQKGRDSHDYKYSSAVLEDYQTISPAWRDRFLAASLFKMRTESESTNGLIERIREVV